ncbi:ragulator complex protein LAMTOR1-like isoform X1 [Amphibalanus amphitrite]|nr:ragulator complex protein LAMTOR1-like isoform X1 [Amphibalanus amphitrite]XP_043190394.1 ragulator complex protein LAMTOR1-like isoform X1 [Amphibalanus amphitrite]XP_043190403.1 ragulator complex protein LAMTOR1-like isoform X1 [Amphibalanus amphitrite]XP_043190409.1 ragulator complex protein LAMTOR1-like isoform X1 [Amphibalanus amphitrite]
MGCCCSTESSDGSDAGDTNERTALLSEQQRLTGSGESGADPPAEAAPRAGDARARGDGETLLDGILHDMAASVIDVAAVDTPNMEQHDYVERCRQYSSALARLSAPPPPALAFQDVPPPLAQRLLSEPPARPDDVRRARQTAERLLEAVQAIQVTPGESLVIPFGQTTGSEP